MALDRRLLPIASLPALLILSAPARAQDERSWDGTWTGVEGRHHIAPIEIAIADGKVVSYTLRGAPFEVQYSRVTPTKVSFGDRDHYYVRLERKSEATASGQIRGRLGVGALSLTRR
jgi:hypothetical protein